MLIRQDFNTQAQLPPRMFMEQIMDKLSKFYCFLWDHKNSENKIKMSWRQLCTYYNKNAFRSNIRKLNNEGLLSYKETDKGIQIVLVSWDDISSEI